MKRVLLCAVLAGACSSRGTGGLLDFDAGTSVDGGGADRGGGGFDAPGVDVPQKGVDVPVGVDAGFPEDLPVGFDAGFPEQSAIFCASSPLSPDTSYVARFRATSKAGGKEEPLEVVWRFRTAE